MCLSKMFQGMFLLHCFHRNHGESGRHKYTFHVATLHSAAGIRSTKTVSLNLIEGQWSQCSRRKHMKSVGTYFLTLTFA